MKVKHLIVPLVSLLLSSCISDPISTTQPSISTTPSATTPVISPSITTPIITTSPTHTSTITPSTTVQNSFVNTTLEVLQASPILNINYSLDATITLILEDCIYIQRGSHAAKVDFPGGTANLDPSVGSMVTVYGYISNLNSNVLTLISVKTPTLVSDNGDSIDYSDILHGQFSLSSLDKKILGTRVRLRGVLLNGTSSSTGSTKRYQAKLLDSKELTVLFPNELLDTVVSSTTAYVFTGVLSVNPTDLTKLELVADCKLSESNSMLSVEQAKNLVTWTENNKFTEEKYFIYGKISQSGLDHQSGGSANFTVEYNNKDLYAYKLKGLGDTAFDSANETLGASDFVIINAQIGYYSSVGIEAKNGYVYDHSSSTSSGGGGSEGGDETGGDPSKGIITVSNRRIPVNATGETGYIYNESGAIAKTLSKGTYYTSIADVAGYISTFRQLPTNYYIIDRDEDKSSGYSNSKKICFTNFGTACRLSPNYYNSNYIYLPWPTDKRYIEVDIGGEGYATSASWNRGAYRLLVNFDGLSEYANDGPIIFYTPDHYDNFLEYSNYYSSWGASFGQSGGTWSEMPTRN